MSTGAIITMVLGCTALWGGFIVSVIINFRAAAKKGGK